MKRRDFIAFSVSSASVSISGCTDTVAEFDRFDNDKVEINVSIFVDDVFVDGMIGTDVKHAMDVCVKAIDCAFSTINDREERVLIDAKTVEDPITVSDDIDGSPINTDLSYSTLRDYLKSVDLTEEFDSNILLSGVGVDGSNGIADIEGKYAVVDAPVPFYGVEEEMVCAERRISFRNRFLTYLIHELGHNIGLTHSMGKVLRLTSDMAYVTPMLSRYVHSNEYAGSKNDFGEFVPNIGDRYVVEVPYYNSDISLDNISIN